MTDTPEAVRLADALEDIAATSSCMFEDEATEAAALLRRIPELEAWKAKVIKAAEEAHGPGAFRFKMSLNGRGTASNVFPKWLDQRWVSFVYAEDDAHIGLHARIAQLEAERDQLRAELERVRVPEGWRLVPAEPTEAMLDRAVAFALNVHLSSGYGWTQYMRDLWGRLLSGLAAAPTPPHADQKGQ